MKVKIPTKVLKVVAQGAVFFLMLVGLTIATTRITDTYLNTTGNITAENITATGFFFGNGSQLTDLVIVNSSYEWFDNTTIFQTFNQTYHDYLDSNTTQEIVDAVNATDLYMNDKSIFDVNWLNATSLNGTYYGDASNLIFSSTFLAENITADAGTHTAGNVTYTQTSEEDLAYNVTEAVGTSPLIIVINFTEVDTFDSVVGRVWYSGGQGHKIQLEILRSDTGVWENYLDFTDMTNYANFYVPVFDPELHVDTSKNNNVSLRFNHIQNGISSHTFSIDYIALVKGITFLTTSDHDSLGGRDNKANHPWGFPTDASRNITGNVNITDSDLDVSGYINASDWTDVLIDFATQVGNRGLEIPFSNVTDKGVTELTPSNFTADLNLREGNVSVGDNWDIGMYNMTMEGVIFSDGTSGIGNITDNSTCLLIIGRTSRLEIC